MTRLRVTTLLCLCFCVAHAAIANAATIVFDAVPLGGASFRYEYRISGLDVDAFHDISIEFDSALYRDLVNPSVPGAEWDVLIFQPDVPLGATGFFDALALVDDASLAGVFSVEFTYLGIGSPGAQPFAILQLDRDGETVLSVLEEGRTRREGGVPEPSIALLLLAAIPACQAGRRRWRRRQPSS